MWWIHAHQDTGSSVLLFYHPQPVASKMAAQAPAITVLLQPAGKKKEKEEELNYPLAPTTSIYKSLARM